MVYCRRFSHVSLFSCRQFIVMVLILVVGCLVLFLTLAVDGLYTELLKKTDTFQLLQTSK